jgi:hypothetical protein
VEAAPTEVSATEDAQPAVEEAPEVENKEAADNE